MRPSKRFTTHPVLLAVMTACLGTALPTQGNQERRVMAEPRVYTVSVVRIKRLSATGAIVENPALIEITVNDKHLNPPNPAAWENNEQYWALGKKPLNAAKPLKKGGTADVPTQVVINEAAHITFQTRLHSADGNGQGPAITASLEDCTQGGVKKIPVDIPITRRAQKFGTIAYDVFVQCTPTPSGLRWDGNRKSQWVKQ